MKEDEGVIRDLITRWASAVHTGKIDDVLADHAEDLVMFDVPPPHEGVRGIAAYGETWPPFFEWQARGAIFEIVELDVTAGTDVAFAFALLRCGSPEELIQRPEGRLRLSLGLRKEGDRWVVAHEHHSFADTTQPSVGTEANHADAEAAIRELHRQWFAATTAKDLDGLMSGIDKDIVSYEHDAPLQYVGRSEVRAVCEKGLDTAPGGVAWDVPELAVIARDDIVIAWGLNRMRATQTDGSTVESWSRGTRLFRRRNDAWSMIHQHVSFPYDPESGHAATDLRP